MDVPRRIARSRIVITFFASSILGLCSGCTAWMGDYAPSEIWDRIAPSPDTWEKLSPSNLWYNMSAARLSKLNAGPGMSSDVYYSISDPLTPSISAAALNRPSSESKTPAVVQPVSDSETNPFSNETGTPAGD